MRAATVDDVPIQRGKFESLVNEAFNNCDPPTWVVWDGIVYALEDMLCGCGFEYSRHTPTSSPEKAKPGQAVRLCSGLTVVLRERPS